MAMSGVMSLRKMNKLGMVVHIFNPSTQEAEAGRYLWVQGRPGLHSQFQDSYAYIERLCLKNKKDKQNKTK